MRAAIQNIAERHFHVGRGGRAKLAISTSFVTRIVGAFVSLVNVPVAVRYLGNEGYGLLILVVSVVGWIQFSNMGLGQGLQNALTEQVALGNKKAQQELISTTFFALLGIALFLIVASVLAFPLVNWAGIFHLSGDRYAADLPKVVALTLGCFISATLWGFIQPIYAARQELHLYNLQGLIASVAGLLGLFLVVYLKGGLLGVAISNIGISAAFAAGFGLWTILGRGLPELRPSFASIRSTAWRNVYRTGIGFLMLQICAVAVFQSDAFIISRFLPVATITPYSVGQRVFSQLIGVLGIVMVSLWPAFGNAKALGDTPWMERIYRKVIVSSLVTYSAAFLVLAFFGNTILTLWVGRDSAPSALLIWAIGFNFLLILWTNTHALLLNALGVVRKQVIVMALHAVIAIGLDVYLVRKFGTIGMALGGSLAYLCVSAWYLPWLYRKTVQALLVQKNNQSP